MTLDPRTALLELATRIDNDGTASQIGSAEEIREIAAALPPSPAVVPNGWVTVPVVATAAMLDAHYEAHARADTAFAGAQEVWAAMLAAAPPSPPALNGAGGIEAAAKLIEDNEIMDGPDGQFLRPRSDENRAGLAYAAAIRSIKETP